MTIDKHLDLSVLSAPVASVDRRSLSQAWYSALYGTNACAAQRSGTPIAKTAPAQGQASASDPQRFHRVRPRGATAIPNASRESLGLGGAQAERRAPRT